MVHRTYFSIEYAKEIGDRIGADWNKFSVEQFKYGMETELEHGLRDPVTNVTNDDPLITGKIALAHLNDYPDYYIRLEQMEREAEEYWGKIVTESSAFTI
ncbi:MAG: hypothetical protein BWY68_00516 [bacterium ADurb.Bin400]|nr:MAG: hypothetical protein BWY68_00516 [bacterium ADurb.Bin400]